MYCAEIVERIFVILLFTYFITIGKDVTFPQILKQTSTVSDHELSICKSNTELKCGLTD